jgi:Skp family chaperone for outer membrane proteins
MSQSPVWWRVLVLSTIILCIAFAVNASGQEKKTGNAFATVDFQKVAGEYKNRNTIESELNAMRTRFDAQLARRDNMPFLTEEEHKELDVLMEKDITKRTDAEKKRIEDLLKKGAETSSAIQALRQKPDKDLTANDKTALQDAEQKFVKAQQVYGALKEQLRAQLENKSRGDSEKIIKEIRTAVGKIAEQKGIAMVFDNNVVLYAGVDLTAPVLSELNKK